MPKTFFKKMYSRYERLRGRAVILLYHRVARVTDDPHQLSVTPRHFREHIKYLKNNYEVVSLQTLHTDFLKGVLRNRVAITFDDGYADNFVHALPILEEYNVPATIFVVAGKIGASESFFWDKGTQLIDRGRACTMDELQKLAQSSVIEIGAHTMTHPHLALEHLDRQREEIMRSKEVLEGHIKKSVTSFAYPFGSEEDFDAKTIEFVKQAGFELACANIQGNVMLRSSPYAFPRRLVRDWDISTFSKKMEHAFYI